MKTLLLSVPLACAAAAPVFAETMYSLDLDQPAVSPLRGHLDLGGAGPAGRWEVNSHFIEKDGRPFIPIVGEFHYCRYPAALWEESLRKMHAGGINVVATYVFWNVHERREGHFDWSGNLNLRAFVAAAQRVGLQCIVRLGPFAHGEMRNGGLPDWLYGQPFEVRSNDPRYLAHVETLYGAIAAQLKGLLYREGGPVIGVQLENEYQHSSAPWEIRYDGSPLERTVPDRDAAATHAGVSVSLVENAYARSGAEHMVTLKTLARRVGLDVPLYTATGWGNATIVPKGSIPVTAAYPFPFWSKAKASPFYLFKDLRREPDYAPVSFDTALYPSIPAELGAGISTTYSRRPYVPEESLDPLIVRVLGSGSNGIGYYMYHGGSNPVFETFMNEDAGHGLPKINYDYQAPLGQYGQPRAHFHRLKLLHLFLDSYGDRLAPTHSILPEGATRLRPEDTTTLRYAARAADGAGFVFLLNYQDHVVQQTIPQCQLQLKARGEIVRIPSGGSFDLMPGTSAILPVNLAVGSARLRSATVQPLTTFKRGGVQHAVFFSIPGLLPELVFASGVVTKAENCESRVDGSGHVVIQGPAERAFSFQLGDTSVLVVPKDLALKVVAPVRDRILFVDGLGLASERELTVLSSGKSEVDVLCYPSGELTLADNHARLHETAAPLASLRAYRLEFTPVQLTASLRQVAPRRYTLPLNVPLGDLNDVLLTVNYVGDAGMAFFDGRLVADHFYSGRPWEISLRQLEGTRPNEDLVFLFHAMRAQATYLEDIPSEYRPQFGPGGKTLLDVRGVTLTPEYKARLHWQ